MTLRPYNEGIKLWGIFGDTPITNNDNIDQDFRDLDGTLLFKKGTDRFEIMHWFEDTFDEFVCGKVMDVTSDETDEYLIKVAGIKIDKRYPNEEDDPEYVGYAILKKGNEYHREIIEMEDTLWTTRKAFTERVKQMITDQYGTIPKNVRVKYEDCTKYPDLRAGFPTLEVLLSDLGIDQI